MKTNGDYEMEIVLSGPITEFVSFHLKNGRLGLISL